MVSGNQIGGKELSRTELGQEQLGQEELSKENIEAVYQQAASAMQSLPLYHPPLTVELLGWQPVAADRPEWAGVLITPWCMNLMASGMAAGEPGSQWLLEVNDHCFELTRAHSDALGHYASGSLLSLMQQFDNMEAARAFANEVLLLIHSTDAELPDTGPSELEQLAAERQRLEALEAERLEAEKPKIEKQPAKETQAKETEAEAPTSNAEDRSNTQQKTLSRRGLLRSLAGR
ncbi:[NiFe]-hydrogenase assembly chaperone HybE [Oceanobacter kriegii]|uniref:[NiFe]-hydrogenase assembly chaperone HybE n=1 Tax=Oceanobacter kriegii TaxID=64972 RepID=UPI00041C3EAA|nr:[NiFe]-hydrogenase assembly chaperone HybE [Oceanobacter kriegii]